jgi:hypothetical protein
MEIIYAVEPDMVANALCTFTLNFFRMYETQSDSVTWQQAELAVYLVSSYVEICKGEIWKTNGSLDFLTNF